ncbi:MAG: hypothetical protein KDC80_10730, partial [Saprospiraceae bacterium]|nr:hypothetical protein [Saprospiraceae bacterium]
MDWGSVKAGILLCILFACNTSENDPSGIAICTTKVKPDKATREMIDKVQSAFNAIDPLQAEYIFNSRRAELLEKKMDGM